jgi:hypothetical protein
MTATDDFRAARDLLLSLREDYDKALSEFPCPAAPSCSSIP